MANTENTREAARKALATYMAQDGHKSTDEQESLADLIADLAHLADQLALDAEPDRTTVDGGADILSTASVNYFEEVFSGRRVA